MNVRGLKSIVDKYNTTEIFNLFKSVLKQTFLLNWYIFYPGIRSGAEEISGDFPRAGAIWIFRSAPTFGLYYFIFHVIHRNFKLKKHNLSIVV